MPIFEYKCRGCGRVLEFLEKTSGNHRHVCDKCGGSDLQKMFSSFAVGHSSPAPQGCRSCPSSQDFGGSCDMGACPHS